MFNDDENPHKTGPMKQTIHINTCIIINEISRSKGTIFTAQIHIQLFTVFQGMLIDNLLDSIIYGTTSV